MTERASDIPQAFEKSGKKIRVALISTGDEVVEGRTVDTNASFLADRIAPLGFDVVSKITVGDYPDRIAWAWNRSLESADVVISTGGLGPTADDLTNETLAKVAGVELQLNEEQADKIRDLFKRLRRTMPENNLRQAMLPEGAVVVENELGTAPGYRLEIPVGERRPVAVVLPGVPREMHAMCDEQVVPWLLTLVGDDDHTVLSRTFQTFGMAESAVDEALEDLVPEEEGRVAFRASFPTIAVRLVTSGSKADAERRLALHGDAIAERLGGAIYAEGDKKMEEVVGELLTERKLKLATAESCTGGLIGSRITDVPGSSNYYVGGVAAYTNKMKQSALGVSKTTLSMFGAVSEETAQEMALGAREKTGADVAVATTGIAGPGGGTEEKPVGTVAIAIAADSLGEDGVRSRMYQLWGTREWIKILTSQVALDWVRRVVLGLDPLESNFGRRVRGSRR
jgi:nicotinamide-nucleotide amidase